MRYIDSHTPQNPFSHKKIRLLLLKSGLLGAISTGELTHYFF